MASAPPNAGMNATVDQVYQQILDRDRADVANLQSKVGQMGLGEGANRISWPTDPKHYGQPVTDNDILAAAEAAQRLHKAGDLYGGIGSEGYKNLVQAYQVVAQRNGVRNPNR